MIITIINCHRPKTTNYCRSIDRFLDTLSPHQLSFLAHSACFEFHRDVPKKKIGDPPKNLPPFSRWSRANINKSCISRGRGRHPSSTVIAMLISNSNHAAMRRAPLAALTPRSPRSGAHRVSRLRSYFGRCQNVDLGDNTAEHPLEVPKIEEVDPVLLWGQWEGFSWICITPKMGKHN